MKDQILTLAQNLIAVPSISGNIEKGVEILECVKKQLPQYEMTPFVSHSYPSLLFSNKSAETREFKLILNAHLDVVPASEGQFIPKVQDGKLFGRGAFDMKAAAAVEILVFKEVAQKVSIPLGLQLTLDEETSGLNGTGYQVDKEGVRGDLVIIGECNSNFKVGNKSKGRIILKLKIDGTSTHSAYAWLGKNALWRMYEILAPIRQTFPHPSEETFDTTVNLTNITIDSPAANKIPGACEATIDIRYAPDDEKTIVAQIKALIPNDVVIEVHHARPYHFVKADNPKIRTLQQITKQVTGTEKPLRYAHATSDATFYSAVGCDAIEFGPIGANAHNDNEWVDVKSLTDYYEILKNFIISLDRPTAQLTESNSTAHEGQTNKG